MKMGKFADLSKRFSLTICILFILALLVTFAGNPVVSVLVVATVSAMAGVGVWEYAKLASTKGVRPAVFLMMIVAVCEVIAFFIAHKWIDSPELPVFVFAVGLGLFFLNRFRRAEEALVNVAVDFFGVAYVAVPLSYMLAILYPIAPSTVQDGRWWLIYLILVTKITDIGAYFVGRIWGKQPLAPTLSPKKTVEGGAGETGLRDLVQFRYGVCGAYFCRLFFSSRVWRCAMVGDSDRRFWANWRFGRISV